VLAASVLVACCGAAGAAQAEGPEVGTPAIAPLADASRVNADNNKAVVVLIGANDYGFVDRPG
jgi:hypothetical protein